MYLFLITARGGSKRLPGKNTKLLDGKPLICYSVDIAKSIATSEEDICVSTDDNEIISVVENCGLKVPFIRPVNLASDTANSYEVILHALEFYESKGKKYEAIVLLQPTSPLRSAKHVKECMNLFKNGIDMVVSVKESKANPYFNLFEEAEDGYLSKSKESSFTRFQDCPPVYEFNGAVYIINTKSLKKYKAFSEFRKIVKFKMDEISSIDIDTEMDWKLAEQYLSNGNK